MGAAFTFHGGLYPQAACLQWSWSALGAAIHFIHPQGPLCTSQPNSDPSTQPRSVHLPPGPASPLLQHPLGCTDALSSHKDGERACTIHVCSSGKPGAPAPCRMAAALSFTLHPQHHGSPRDITAPSCPIYPGLTVLQTWGGRPAARGSAPFPGGLAASAPGWGRPAAQQPMKDAAQG